MTEREKRRAAQKHFAYLGDLLNQFYYYLGHANPKPSDDEVRATFIKYRTAWVNYASKHSLDDNTKKEFTRQVSLVWHKKMDTTESEIQK